MFTEETKQFVGNVLTLVEGYPSVLLIRERAKLGLVSIF